MCIGIEPVLVIYLIKVLLTFVIFVKASIHDLRDREIPDYLWKLMITFAISLDAAEYILHPYDLVFATIQFIIIFAFALTIHYVAGVGGADAKALICLSVMFPVYPRMWNFPILNQGFGVFAFTVLTNSLVLVILFPTLMICLKNLREKDAPLLYRFTGYRVDADRIPRFHLLLEYVDEKGNLVRLVRGIEPDENMLKRLKDAKEKGIIDKVWVTPALPFIVYMVGGFVVAVTVGDILVSIITFLTFGS